MPPTTPILALGSITMDLVVEVDHFPVAGETVLARGARFMPGGKALNEAIAIARLGYPAALAGRVGGDAFSDQLVAAARAEGVDTACISRDPGLPTALALPMVMPGGENAIVAAPGPNMALSEANVEACASVIRGSAMLLMQLEIPVEAVVAAARIAAAAGVPVLLNAAPIVAFPAELLELISFLVVNEGEAAALAPGALDDAGRAMALAGRVREAAIITLGSRGCLVAKEGRAVPVPAYQVAVVDTVGAGDAFCGALAVGLCEGLDVLSAARFASAAAALSVTRAGAAPSLPPRAEVDALLRSGNRR